MIKGALRLPSLSSFSRLHRCSSAFSFLPSSSPSRSLFIALSRLHLVLNLGHWLKKRSQFLLLFFLLAFCFRSQDLSGSCVCLKRFSFLFFPKLSERFVKRNGLQQECSRSCNDGCSRRTDHAVSHGNGGRGAESCSEHRKRARQQFSGIGSGGIGGQCYGFRCRIRLVVKRRFVCVCGGCRWTDGRTGDVVPEKVVLLLENGFAVWGFRFFCCCYFYVLATAGEKNNRELLPILGL